MAKVAKGGGQRSAFAFGTVVGVVRQWRQALASARELAAFGQSMASIAEELGLSSAELQLLAAKGTDAAKELPCLLESLGISLQIIREKDPMVLRDLQRVCSTCDHKRQCHRDSTAGMLPESFRRYCPNADTVNAIKGDLTFAKQPSSVSGDARAS